MPPISSEQSSAPIRLRRSRPAPQCPFQRSIQARTNRRTHPPVTEQRDRFPLKLPGVGPFRSVGHHDHGFANFDQADVSSGRLSPSRGGEQSARSPDPPVGQEKPSSSRLYSAGTNCRMARLCPSATRFGRLDSPIGVVPPRRSRRESSRPPDIWPTPYTMHPAC